MNRCAPGLGLHVCLLLLQRHSLLAGLDRGLAEACDGGADLVGCVSPVRVRGRCAVAKLNRGWLSEMPFARSQGISDRKSVV